MKRNFELSNPPNAYLFKELGGYWVEVSAITAQQIFTDSSIELCVYTGENESVVQSQEQLEEAIADNSMLVIFLGDAK